MNWIDVVERQRDKIIMVTSKWQIGMHLLLYCLYQNLYNDDDDDDLGFFHVFTNMFAVFFFCFSSRSFFLFI